MVSGAKLELEAPSVVGLLVTCGSTVSGASDGSVAEGEDWSGSEVSELFSAGLAVVSEALVVSGAAGDCSPTLVVVSEAAEESVASDVSGSAVALGDDSSTPFSFTSVVVSTGVSGAAEASGENSGAAVVAGEDSSAVVSKTLSSVVTSLATTEVVSVCDSFAAVVSD